MGWFIGITVFVYLFMLILCCNIIHKDVEPQNCKEGLMGGIIIFTAIGLLWGLVLMGKFAYDKPQAIDVYRGKTDIDVTYTIKNCDTIKCDTTVVWKNSKELL